NLRPQQEQLPLRNDAIVSSSKSRRPRGREEEEPPAQADQDSSLQPLIVGWQRMRLGISLISWSLLPLVLILVLYVLVSLVYWIAYGQVSRPGVAANIAQVAGAITLLILVLVLVVGFVQQAVGLAGYCLCLYVPGKAERKVPAVVAVALGGLGLLCSLALP